MQQGSVSDGETSHVTSSSTMQQQSEGEHVKVDCALEQNSSTDQRCNEAASSPVMLEFPWISVKQGDGRRLESAEANSNLNGESPRSVYTLDRGPVEQVTTQRKTARGLVSFDALLGLSLCELRLLRESLVTAFEASQSSRRRLKESRGKQETNGPSTCGTEEHAGCLVEGDLSQCFSIIGKMGAGSARILLHSTALGTGFTCKASLEQVYISLGLHELSSNTSNFSKEPKEGMGTCAPDMRQGSTAVERDGCNSLTPDVEDSSVDSDPLFASDVTTGKRALRELTASAVSGLSPSSYLVAPFLHFAPTEALTYQRSSAAAADAAAALLVAGNNREASRLSKESPSAVSFESLQSALSSERLRLSVRWSFPPRYPGEPVSDAQVPSTISETLIHQLLSDHRYKVTGEGHWSRQPMGDDFARQVGSPTAAVTTLSECEARRLFMDAAEQEEVLVEDLSRGRCFLIPAKVHAAVASRHSWHVLAKRGSDISIDATICLKSLLHTVEVRCNPLRITLHWRALADVIGGSKHWGLMNC